MIRLYFIALVCALLVSLIVTPLSIWLAKKFGAMDQPDERKVHVEPRARWGGVGIISGFFAGLIALHLFFPRFEKLLAFSKGIVRKGKVVFTLNLGEQLAGILAGVLLLFVLGAMDDRKPVRPGMKLSLQILAAYIAMTYGVRIYGLSIPGLEEYSHFPLWLMQVATVLWLVSAVNAVNLIDGLDGLAGGVVAIITAAFLAVTLVQGEGLSQLYDQQMKLAGVIAASLLGGVLGFLIYNFYPARVFMGDGGSQPLGFIIGCIAVIGAFKTTTLAVLLCPFLLIAVPAADMAIAFARRLMNKNSPFVPDRGHMHHRLLDAGWTQREVVFLVYAVTLLLAFVSVTVVGIKK